MNVKEIAAKLGISPARVSQLRKELRLGKLDHENGRWEFSIIDFEKIKDRNKKPGPSKK